MPDPVIATLGIKMSFELAEKFLKAGQDIISAPVSAVAIELNRQLNKVLGWPFRAATGAAFDKEGQTTTQFGTLIFTCAEGKETPDASVSVAADTLACVVEVTHTLDLMGLREAYARVVHAKALKKTPVAVGVPRTTITFGVIFAVVADAPLEQFADELDRLNRQTPSTHWPDMVVVASHGLITYAVQFPGELSISAQWMPPAEGALVNYIPAVYVVMVIKPSGSYTFNQMMHTILAHLFIFSPGATLPNRDDIVMGVQSNALIQNGYQYNLSGALRPVPSEQIQGRALAPRPFLVQDQKGETLAALSFLKWQDGGVILLWGKLPLEGLMVFLGGDVLKKVGTIRREGFQLSHVLPINEQNFHEMLQRLEQRSNMIVRNDPGKFVVQKFADEGASSPFMARLFIGILDLGKTLPDNTRQAFETAYEPLITTLLEIRTIAKELTDLYADHARKVAAGSIVQMQGPTVHITENIDRIVRKKVEEFLSSATRSFKDRMQRLTTTLGVDIGFLYQKPEKFERGIAAFAPSDGPLAAYLRQARQWGDELVQTRNNLDHGGWQLPRISYTVNGSVVTVVEPLIESQPVTLFVAHKADRLLCFVEDVTVHCIQRRLPSGLSITEIPLPKRSTTMPLRFQPTPVRGGMPLWQIDYQASAFEAN